MLSVLRIGGGGVEVEILRDALLSHFASLSSVRNDDTTAPTNQNSNQQLPGTISINNKYFTASVSLEKLNDNETNTSSMKKEDGILLIFNSSSPPPPLGQNNSFSSLTAIHDAAEQSQHCGDLLRLCIGVTNTTSSSSSPSATSETEFSRRVLWCLDRGYEYVEADLSEWGRLKGHEERDKEGFARVVEAVGGTVWSSAVMHPKKRVVVPDVTPQKEEEEEEEDVENEVRYEPPPMINFTEGMSDEMSGPIMTMPDNPLDVKPSEEKKDTVPRLEGDESHNEHLFDDLERCMKEAAQIRSEAKNGTISDDERRQRAGDTALRLMGLLDSLDFDDDEEGIDSSDEE